MTRIRKRPVVLKTEADLTIKNIENILSNIDTSLSLLDDRRIVQITQLEDDADAETVRSTLQSIIAALNASDLTEE